MFATLTRHLATAVCLASASIAAAQSVDIRLQATTCTTVSGTARVDLFLISQGPGNAALGATDVILEWDPAQLLFLGDDESQAGYAWLAAGFLPDPDGINADLLDGDALYTALARPTQAAVATPAPGLRVTTFLFRPLVAAPTGVDVSIVPSRGAFGRSRVLSFQNPGLEITGALGGPAGVYTCPIGTRSCSPGVLNSTGQPGVLSIVGSASVAVNDLTLTASQLPLNAFGYFLASRNLGTGINPPASQGVLCLLPDIGRGIGGTIFNTGALGVGSTTVNVNVINQPLGPVAALPGDTWHFQAWHRDANPTVTSNFTDVVSLTFE